MTDDPNAKYRPPARPYTVAVDFDATLCEWAFPECGAPIETIVEKVRRRKAQGQHIIIHTCRVNSHWEEPERTDKVQDMLNWLVANDVPFDAVWGLEVWNADHARVWDTRTFDEWRHTERHDGRHFVWRYATETGKPLADEYWDDRASSVEELLNDAESEADTCDTD